jgi:hypothetical protein
MKFKVVWQEERAALIDAVDIKDAENQIMAMIKRSIKPEAVKLLSIHRVDPTPPAPLASAA